MVLIREMQSEDIGEASKVLCYVAQDTWERYEKGYYPKRALEFDISKSPPEHLKEKFAKPGKQNDSWDRFWRNYRGIWLGKTWFDRCSP